MNRDEALAAARALIAASVREVDIPGFGRAHIRSLTLAQVGKFDNDADTASEVKLARRSAWALCDAQGERLFDPQNADDIALLVQLPWETHQRILAESEKANTPNP